MQATCPVDKYSKILHFCYIHSHKKNYKSLKQNPLRKMQCLYFRIRCKILRDSREIKSKLSVVFCSQSGIPLN